MNAIVTGVVSGIQGAYNDAITLIEIVWKLGAETEAQARTAGRYVDLTSAPDIAAFQAAGYALSSANLIAGNTYTPAVRVTESRGGSGSYVGGWTNGTSVTATTTTTLAPTTTTTTTTTAGPSIWSGMTNTISDAFNRSSGINGAGTNWVNTGVGYTDLPIAGNAVSVGAGVFAGMNWAANPGADQFAEVDPISLGASGGQVVVMVRSSASVNTCYQGALSVLNSTYSVVLNKVVAGTVTAIGGASVTLGATMPQKIRVGAKGTTIEVQTYDGSTWTTRRTATDSSIATGYPALSVQVSSSADNFVAGTL